MAVAPHRLIAPAGRSVDAGSVRALVAAACPAADYRGQRVILIIPDGTRTAPIGLMFKTLFAQLAGSVKKLDVMLALGTHPAMPDEAINRRGEITAAERASRYKDVEFINHEWANPAALRDLGSILAATCKKDQSRLPRLAHDQPGRLRQARGRGRFLRAQGRRAPLPPPHQAQVGRRGMIFP